MMNMVSDALGLSEAVTRRPEEKPMEMAVRFAASLTLAAALVATPVASQTHTETIVSERRTSVSVEMDPQAAQAFMPEGWTPAGSSLSVIFMDRPVQRTPDGGPLDAGANLFLVLVMAGRNAATGETKTMVVGGYSADPAGAPGAYGVYRPGEITLSRTEQKRVVDGQPVTDVEERWIARGEDGDLELEISFSMGVAEPRDFNLQVYSGADPAFYRNYRGRQASHSLRGRGGVDTVKSVSLTASGGRLGRAIDGSEALGSISTSPYYTRETFVP
jgi:hypothetical protein